MDKETKRAIILDNYQYPTHKGLTSDQSYIKANTRSDSCIDNIDLMMKVDDDKIVDVVFDGEACAICTSATSIIVKTLIGKSVNEAKEIISNYQNMINEEPYDANILGELNVFDEIYLQPARKNCALLSSKSAKKILDEVGK
ncbi:SUF system NifU family Fe-S cluster assembly protein [bacterium]|nr:SUF system NifU family Fe-S cluster assembly protein [bacterium]